MNNGWSLTEEINSFSPDLVPLDPEQGPVCLYLIAYRLCVAALLEDMGT